MDNVALSFAFLPSRPPQTPAAGCYGGYVVQLAKADGLRAIADASPSDTDLACAVGADVVVPRGDDIAQRIREVAPEAHRRLEAGGTRGRLVIVF